MLTKAVLSRSRFALVLVSAVVAAATCAWQAPSAGAAATDSALPVTPTLFTAIDDAGHNPVTSVLSGTTVHDTGTVLSTVIGTPSGTVSFTWFANGTCAGTGEPAGSTVDERVRVRRRLGGRGAARPRQLLVPRPLHLVQHRPVDRLRLGVRAACR